MNRPLLALLAAALAVPAAAAISRDELKKALDANPDLVLDALKKGDKSEFFKYVIEAQQEAQQKNAREQEEREKKERDEAFKNPLKPDLAGKSLRVRGNAKAPITIVEYSDFQCPYCQRGYGTLEGLRKKYGEKVRVVFKDYPLPFHPMAMPAAQVFEAVALQSPEKAWKLHDTIFENQNKLSKEYLEELVKGLGLDSKKVEADANSQKVKDKIEADMREAKGFGIEGTPAYLINGVPLKGAYPAQDFDEIIARHLKG